MAIPGYKILRKIGDGGMSSVYLAIQLSVGREVALKVLSPELRQDSDYRDKFFREANIVGTLSHPNIIAIYDVGSEGEHCYIAMDYLPGASCSEQIKAGQISVPSALRIVKDIAAALNYTHNNGYVHADVKADNILFRGDGSAILTDFGIAISTRLNSTTGKLGIAGTPNYMSPEQSQGNPIDGRSDIYSLGVVLFEMLTGSLPYKAKDAVGVAVQHLSADIPKLPPNLSMFQPVINKMLAKKASARYQSGQDVIQAINTIEGSFKLGGNPTLDTTHSIHTRSLLSALISTLVSRLTHKMHRPAATLPHGNTMAFAGGGSDNSTNIEEWNYSNGSNTARLQQTNANTKTFNTEIHQALNVSPSNNSAKYVLAALLLALLAGGSLWLFTYYKSEFASSAESKYDSAKAFSSDAQQAAPASPRTEQTTSTAERKSQALPDKDNTRSSTSTLPITATSGSKHSTYTGKQNDVKQPVVANQTSIENSAALEEQSAAEGNTAVAGKTAAEEDTVADEPAAIEPQSFSLMVNTAPANATIRILNIKPKYRRGMLLDNGDYHISVSAKGYKTASKWVNIKGQPLSTSIRLEKVISTYAPGMAIEKPMRSGIQAPKTIVIPKGSFLMGDVSGAGFNNATPVHQVTISKPFAITATEITIGEYKLFAKAKNLPLPAEIPTSDDKQPIAAVSWQDAVDYASWLSEETGAHYRLPSEAEWEYAARAGSETLYWWGEDNNDSNANCRRGCKSPWSKLFSSSSAPVASFAANAFGLYDTAGNVAEWTQDCYAKNYREVPANGDAYHDKKCELRSVRGGSFLSSSSDIGSAARSSSAPSSSSHTIGFRLVLELE